MGESPFSRSRFKGPLDPLRKPGRGSSTRSESITMNYCGESLWPIGSSIIRWSIARRMPLAPDTALKFQGYCGMRLLARVKLSANGPALA